MPIFTRAQRYKITLVASSGGRFRDFSPYVPAISDRGHVAFQAACTDGTNGLFLHDGHSLTELVSSANGVFAEFTSHPALNASGQVCFYARLSTGDNGVFSLADGQLVSHATSASAFASIGPLGPTLNETGTVAFRANTPNGAGVFVAHGEASETIAETDTTLRGFQGLPVINPRGEVAFRADLGSGHGAIFLRRLPAAAAKIVDTEGEISALGLFPCLNRHGTVAFAATRRNGTHGIFTFQDRQITDRLGPAAAFATARGALINDAGDLVFFAQPKAAALGIYFGDDPEAHRLLGQGDTLFGAPVAEFALNPVSINNAGQLAIRVKLVDGRQHILRADPC